MTAYVNTGATIEVSAALPATYDDTGYEALSWTGCGEIVDVSEIAKAWAVVAHQAVTRAYPEKIKDTYDVTADTGQVILLAGLAAAASYSFQITLPSGDIAYFTGKILKAGIGSIASGSVETLAVTVAVDPESLFES